MFAGEWDDWIDSFMRYTEGIPSPELFRLWSGISAVAASLERRVWVVSAGDCVYPGLYTLLVGKPGSGKSQAIRQTAKLWHTTKDLKIAANSVTKASLTDELAEAKQVKIYKNGSGQDHLVEYHSLQIAASEFGVLVPAHDLDFLNFLNQIYDNDPNYRESRRTRDRKIDIINPQINILAGTQPAYLATLLPEEAWGMGFMTRMLMIYSGETFKVNLFGGDTTNAAHFKRLSGQLKILTAVYGEAHFDDKAKQAIETWYAAGCPPEPDHSRLISYNARRILHVIRLCMVSAASAGHPTTILHSDFVRATDWLINAEATMPDIFKEMVQKSDAQIISELHLHVWQLWVKERKWIHEARLLYFLQSKVTSDKINRILDVAVRSNILDKHASEPLYRPRPKNEHGVE